MQAPFDIPADLDTAVSAYLKLAPFVPRFLLESVENGTQVGRYSFIGFGDALDVRLDKDGLKVNGAVRSRPENGAELLDGLRAALARAPKLTPDIDGVPFDGGLVGITGYDVLRYFERIPDSDPNPVEPEAAFIAPESLLVIDHLTRRAALLHAGSDEQRAKLRVEVVSALRGPLPKPRKPGRFSRPVATMSRAEYTSGVERARKHIAAGDVFQLVLSIAFEGECDLAPFEVYRALRLLNPSPYMYYCDLGNIQVVGSSPEALVRLDRQEAALRPIAGTRPRGANGSIDDEHAQSLLDDPKEAAEHVMLVDLARNDLNRVATPGTVRVDPFRSIERYSHVMHLVSGVTGSLERGCDAFDLFAATFPAGTVVGAPKIRAAELIDENEPVRRGLYAGTVGYFAKCGAMDQAIAIRTLTFRDGRYRFQAGAGIVADSVADKEYEEVLAKSAALRRALEIAEEGL